MLGLPMGPMGQRTALQENMKQIMASKMGEPLEGSIASRRSEAPPSQAKLLEAQAKILALGKKLLDVKKEQPGGETQES